MLLLANGKMAVSDLSKLISDAGNQLGFVNLKDKQVEVITSFVNGNEVFAHLPTRYSKSICYVIMPLLSILSL